MAFSLRLGLSLTIRGTIALVCAHRYACAIEIYPGPEYDRATQTGFQDSIICSNHGSSGPSGFAAGSVGQIQAGKYMGNVVVRWDTSGAAPTVLGNLGVSSSGTTDSTAYAVSESMTIVGTSAKYANGVRLGNRAVRWDVGRVIPTELGILGTASSGYADSIARATNIDGITVGAVDKFSQGLNIGERAVRWDPGSTVPIELGRIDARPDGSWLSSAISINDMGTIVGTAFSYGGNWGGVPPAVRWDAGGTAAFALGDIETGRGAGTLSVALAVNNAGIVIGAVDNYDGPVEFGSRAVRWDATGRTGKMLGDLGVDTNGITETRAADLNAAGTVVGYAEKHSGGVYTGIRAVRWDANQTAATELQALGPYSMYSGSRAFAINDAGIIVGFCLNSAVLWDTNGTVLDLNKLLSPQDAKHWKLTGASTISDTNWVSGSGTFDPDGSGPLFSYPRMYLLQIPEPASAAMLTLLLIPRRRRCQFH